MKSKTECYVDIGGAQRGPLALARARKQAGKSRYWANILAAEGKAIDSKRRRIAEREEAARLAEIENAKSAVVEERRRAQMARVEAYVGARVASQAEAERRRLEVEPRYVLRQRWVQEAQLTPRGIVAVPVLREFYEREDQNV